MRNEVKKLAEFSFSMDINKVIPEGLNDENLALQMIKAGQKVMQGAIGSAASKHRKTGSMASSVKYSKPIINRNGDAVGRVKFYGKDKNGMQNSSKAVWIEYGTRHQKAQPFVRPAIKGAEGGIRSAMEKIFNQKAR